MSDAEEALDGSVSGDEAEQKQSPEKRRSSPDKSYMWGAGEIIEGKRVKKTVERLDIQAPKKAVKLSIGKGSGEKLGDIPRIGFQLNKMKTDVLLPLHSLLFDRRGKLSMIKKNIRQFNGFSFDADSEQFTKKRDRLQKNTKSKLYVMCGALDLEKKGSHSELVDKILAFLMAPKSTGKRLPKKKKRSKKNLSGDAGESKKKPSRKRSSGNKQKPSSTSSPKKSKAIVMDSSSDEEEEKAESGESDNAGSGEESGGESGDKPQSEELSDEEESPKAKAQGKPKKTPPAKKTANKKPGKKRSRKEVTDSESESSAEEEEEEEEEPKKKKSKPAAKTKKADSSSNSKASNPPVDDSSDDDEPLSKMVKKAPSDDQLKETVQTLLKEANLEELTMKQICQKVFDTYSEHDLSSKKDFIKQTVKSLIT